MRLSFVLLTYNRAERLRRTLEDLLPQTDGSEVLVCDNASTDETAEVMRDFASRFSNLVHHRNSINVGYARNLFAGFIAAKGDRIVFLADDDIIPQGFVAELRGLIASNPQVDLLIPSRRRSDDGVAVTYSTCIAQTETVPRSRRAVTEAFIHSGAVPGLVVRSGAVQGGDWWLDGTIYPQIGLASRLAARGGLVLAAMLNSIICLGADDVKSRIKDAMSRPGDYGVIERARIADRLAAEYEALIPDGDLLKRELWGWAFDVFEEMCRAGLSTHARTVYLASILRDPACNRSASFLFLWARRALGQPGFLAASAAPVLLWLPRALLSRRFWASALIWLRR